MKPAPFRYHRPATLADALAALAEAGPEAKLLAGGQSLMPMANFRLLRPSVLIDIAHIPGLDRIEATSSGVRLGALVRHAAVEASVALARSHPILGHVMGFVAHPAIRNRGTLGGSLAHNDPAAEWPLLALLLEARLAIASARGERRLDAAAFPLAPLATALAADEVLTAIEIPALAPGSVWGFAELARRHGDFALAAVGVLLRRDGDAISGARIALAGVDETALRATAAEAILNGARPDAATLGRVVAAIRAAIRPMEDLHASAAYRRHLAGVLAARAIGDAWLRAGGTA
ncbi:MAG: FAD binding domain-containing protein [Rhodospirillales bacterium]|nr:FAD binding domain-containing protein [Rhodospirillales bacterium]